MINYIYEDDDIVVFCKDHGLHCVADRTNQQKTTVRSILDDKYGKIYMVHRLDAGTGGIMIAARNKNSHRHLCTQFEQGHVSKEYIAVTRGNTPAVTVMLPIASRPSRGRYKINFTSGRDAVSTFIPVAEKGGTTLVKAFPRTGRTHQIRVHLKALKTPLYQDWLYNEDCPDRRLTLFASSLMFNHPSDNEMRVFTAEPSTFMESFFP